MPLISEKKRFVLSFPVLLRCDSPTRPSPTAAREPPANARPTSPALLARAPRTPRAAPVGPRALHGVAASSWPSARHGHGSELWGRARRGRAQAVATSSRTSCM